MIIISLYIEDVVSYLFGVWSLHFAKKESRDVSEKVSPRVVGNATVILAEV
jgi:hypothetical protein